MKSIDPQTYAIFSSLVEELIGLRYEDSSKEILIEKLGVAAETRGFDSLTDYYYFLRYDAAGTDAIQELIEQLVVSETYFFRELPALEWLVQEVLLPKVQTGLRPRVWSAACATGEEPLTLAMLLDERGALGSVDILATDVSARSLGRARAGRFRPRSLRDPAPERLASRYLERAGDQIVVERRLVDHVDWRQLNLLEIDQLSVRRAFDAIVCRNVLIYFSENNIRKVVRALMQRLAEDGILLVGVSESLFRVDANLVCEERSGVFFYGRGRR